MLYKVQKVQCGICCIFGAHYAGVHTMPNIFMMTCVGLTTGHVWDMDTGYLDKRKDRFFKVKKCTQYWGFKTF